MTSRPGLSVVVATREGWSAMGPIVDAFVPQLRAVQGEMVVADSSGERPSVPAGVRWIPLRDKNMLRLRAIALGCSRGEVVAIGEDHSVPPEGWCTAVLRAHTEHPEADAIVGCLRNATNQTVTGRIHFVAYAAPFTQPMPRLPNRPPPAATVSVKRRSLDGLGEEPGAFEADLIPRLFEEGRMAVDDRIVLDHYQDHGLNWSILNAFATTRSMYGVAPDRSDRGRRSEVARWVLRNVAPRIWREACSAVRANDAGMRELAGVLPIALASGIGGIVGTLTGPGRAPERIA